MDASELVALLKKRDRQGIARLYDTYAASLYGIIYRIVPSEAKAEALLERTLLIVWESIHHYNARHASFFTWIATIARNQANEGKTAVGTSPAPADTLHLTGKDQSLLAMTRLTEGMDQTSAQVLQCVYFGGISTAETAALLNVPLNTVRIKLKSALGHLQLSFKSEPRQLLSWSLFVLSLSF